MKRQDEYMKPSNRPALRTGSIMMRIAAVLVCMVMASFYLMGGMFARYTASGGSKDDARVAKFQVDVTFQNVAQGTVDATLQYNAVDSTYAIAVNNASEVAIRYDIQIKDIEVQIKVEDREVENAVLQGVSLTLEGATHEVDGTAVLFENVGVMPANAENPNTHVLQFMVDWDAFLKDISGENVTATITFNVQVDVVQVD